MRVVESRRVYDGRVVNLRVDTVEVNGEHHVWEVVEHTGAVVVIPRPAPDEMVLVRQYRHPLQKQTWEVCAGGIDPGETPHEAALRELREETGFRARTLRRLWSAYSAPGFCSELLHFFETDDYEIGEAHNVGGEDIEIATFPLMRLREMIERDELPDAKTQIAVLWACGLVPREDAMIKFALTALVLALLLPAATAAQTEPLIRIGAGPDMTSEPIVYADKAGLFKKAGLNVQIEKLAGAAVVGAALAGGSLDIGKASALSVATGYGRGLPFTIIGAIAAYNGDRPDLALIVLANSDIKTAKDLEGKVLADVSLEDMNTVATLAWLDQHGVDSAALKYVEIPATAALPAMEAGRVVGSTVYEPIYTADMATGKVRVLGYPFDAISKHFADSVLFANVNWVSAHRDLVARFLQVMKTATAYVGSHEDELVPMLAGYAGVDPASIAKVHRPERRVTISVSDIQPVIDTAAKYHAIPKAFPASELICTCALKN